MRFTFLRWLRGAAVVAAAVYCSALLYWAYPYRKARLFEKGAILEEPKVVEIWPEAAALRESLMRKFLQDLDLPKLLNREVQHYQWLCDRTYSRSTLLLRAAIITAIGGLGA